MLLFDGLYRFVVVDCKLKSSSQRVRLSILKPMIRFVKRLRTNGKRLSWRDSTHGMNERKKRPRAVYVQYTFLATKSVKYWRFVRWKERLGAWGVGADGNETTIGRRADKTVVINGFCRWLTGSRFNQIWFHMQLLAFILFKFKSSPDRFFLLAHYRSLFYSRFDFLIEFVLANVF